MQFMAFDRVQYTGTKLAQQVKGLSGEILSRVGNETGSYVVSFGNDAYVIAEGSMRPFISTPKDEKSAEVEALMSKIAAKRDPDLLEPEVIKVRRRLGGVAAAAAAAAATGMVPRNTKFPK